MKTQIKKTTARFFLAVLIASVSSISLQADFIEDLDFKGKIKSFLITSLRLPNLGNPEVKVEKSGLDNSTSAFFNIERNFGSIRLQSDNLLNNQIDLTHTNHLLYYGLVDTVVSVDIGINLMKFDDNIKRSVNGIVKDVNINQYVPALFVRTSYDIANSDIYFITEASIHNQGTSSIFDSKIYLTWDSNSKLDAEIGYHHFDANWQGFDATNQHISFDGFYATIKLSF